MTSFITNGGQCDVPNRNYWNLGGRLLGSESNRSHMDPGGWRVHEPNKYHRAELDGFFGVPPGRVSGQSAGKYLLDH